MKTIVIVIFFVTVRTQTCVGEFGNCLSQDPSQNITCCDSLSCVAQNDFYAQCLSDTLAPVGTEETTSPSITPTTTPLPSTQLTIPPSSAPENAPTTTQSFAPTVLPTSFPISNQAESGSSSGEEANTDLIVLTVLSVLSLCVIISLLAVSYLYLTVAEEGSNRLKIQVGTLNTDSTSHKTGKVLSVHTHKRRSGETEMILNRSISAPRADVLSVHTYPQIPPTEVVLSTSVSQHQLAPSL
eukprot:augustus_masked-scaffold_48-processed-gene-0.41-mRNA-1 protein AED:1.00 eAED:1.00 QI:0/-1/0/0/-1/1/1/0/240